MPCTVVVGAAFGDEGKGKIVSYLALKDKVDVAIRTGSVNAGHTVIFKGKEYRMRLVPSAFVYDKCRLLVGAGANVNPAIFLDEVKRTGVEGRIGLDFQCSIIERKHVLRDRIGKIAKKIGTTGHGVGPAIEDRAKRVARLARDVPELRKYLTDVALEANEALDRGKKVLIEGTQGLQLSLYHGTYPYVTSRDTSAASICGEAGIPPTKVDDVLVVLKSFTSRVGSGPLPGELSEEEATKRGWIEVATVTGRRRRAAPFNFDIAKRAVMINGATQLALTKVDVLFPECRGVKKFEEFPKPAVRFIEEIEERLKVPIVLIGTGPLIEEIIDRRK